MGAGKTTLGTAVATRLGWSFLDSDAEIEAKHGRTGAEIASEDGVPFLHERELEIFVEMARAVEPSVIAPAASVVDHDEGRRLLMEHFTIWLKVSPELAEARRETGSHRRPIDVEEQERRDESRGRWLERLADIEVDNSGQLDVVADEVVDAVTRRHTG